MKADVVFTNIAQLATPTGASPKRGAAMREWRVLERAAIAVRDGLIVWVGPESDWSGEAGETVDLGARAVIPGLVDPHTHAVWAGDRLRDFEARASKVSYEEILRAGGGIRSTVRATQAASLEALIELAAPRLEALMRSGATTIEVKSGYGFTPEAELRMLEAVRALQARIPARLVPTLLVHIPPQDPSERPAYLEMVCAELIPEVAAKGLALAVDVFTEREAWSVSETRRILETALEHGLKIKLHVDQFHAIGGLELGVELGASSVDHLEASGPEQIAALASSDTVGIVLPGVSLHLGLPAAPARALVDAGAIVAIGTDLNPGSSPVYSSQFALALGVRLNGLTPTEALQASTLNAAAALGLADCGRLEVGTKADFLVLDGSDWREMAYALGRNPVARVFISGEAVNP